jgi:poly-gamma-glutamate synthesis protein (capsule biosynthesis protein)
VVYLHWGKQRQRGNSRAQAVLARRLIRAGADVIVGCHSHRVNAAGRMGGALVCFGLGDFVWHRDKPTGALEVVVTGRRVDSYRWLPARVAGGPPIPLGGARAAAAIRMWERQREIARLEP